MASSAEPERRSHPSGRRAASQPARGPTAGAAAAPAQAPVAAAAPAASAPAATAAAEAAAIVAVAPASAFAKRPAKGVERVRVVPGCSDGRDARRVLADAGPPRAGRRGRDRRLPGWLPQRSDTGRPDGLDPARDGDQHSADRPRRSALRAELDTPPAPFRSARQPPVRVVAVDFGPARGCCRRRDPAVALAQ